MTDYVIGADEVGRGCLAGDMYVCAVMVPCHQPSVGGVTDSKALSPKRRSQLHRTLTTLPELRFRIAKATPAQIEALGIEGAVKVCFHDAVQAHLDDLDEHDRVVSVKIDGNPFVLDLETDARVRFIVKGDLKEWVIGAASIIAKVERDAYMTKLAEQHPGYGWERNKGYGTPEHITGIEQKGLTVLHRARFCRKFQTPDTQDAGSIFDELFGS